MYAFLFRYKLKPDFKYFFHETAPLDLLVIIYQVFMKTLLSTALCLLALLSSCASNDENISTIKELNQNPLLEKNVKIEVLSWSPRIFMVRNFLTDQECDYIIELAKPKVARSTVIDNETGRNKLDEGRTSEGMFVSESHTDPLIKDIETRISLVTMIPEENGEDLQVLRYGLNGEYRPHYDYFNLLTVGGVYNFHRGGQRVASFLMYLNTPEEGGETVFPKVDIKVIPKKGDALLFYDCCLDGRTDPQTFHGGLPVIRGEKWLATKWLRQNVFKRNNKN